MEQSYGYVKRRMGAHALGTVEAFPRVMKTALYILAN